MERCAVCKMRTETRDGVCTVCSTRPKDRVHRRHVMLVPGVTWVALALTWLGVLLYVHLVDIGHPGEAATMTRGEKVDWAHRALLVMLTGEGRALDSPPELTIGLALVPQFALFYLGTVGALKLYARQVGWVPRWREVLPGVLTAAAGVGVVCVMVAQVAAPSMSALSAFPVPFLITAGILFSALWPPQHSHDDIVGRIGAGVGLAWKLFALSLVPGAVLFVIGVHFFYGSWSGLRDLWSMYLFNSIPQDLIGAAAFTFGGLHDGFSGRTGLLTGEPHWRYQIFPLVQVWVALVVGHRFVLRRRRGARIGLELIFTGITIVVIWTTVIWLVHFTADPRQYTKYTMGWGPDSASSLACMGALMALVFITLSMTRGRFGGWAPRLSSLVGGRSMHPTWAAALTDRLHREGLRVPRRMASVEISDEDRAGPPLPNGAMPYFGAAAMGAIALGLLLVPSSSLEACGPMFRAAFVQDRVVPDHQAPAEIQEQIDAVGFELDLARAKEKEALDAAARGRELVANRDRARLRLEAAERNLAAAREQERARGSDPVQATRTVLAREQAKRSVAAINREIAGLERRITGQQASLDRASASSQEVRGLIGRSVSLENAWRAEHMDEYIAVVDHNAQAVVCREEGRSRLVGGGIFGGLSLAMFWVGVASARARRKVALTGA